MATFFCIYSGKEWDESQRSEEHIVPIALGGPDEFVTHDVAKLVNSTVGSAIDAALASDMRVQLARGRLGLAGQSGKVPHLINTHATVGGSGERVRYIVSADGASEIRTFPKIAYDDAGRPTSFTCAAGDEARVLADLRAKFGNVIIENRAEVRTENPALTFKSWFKLAALQSAFVKMAIGTAHFALGYAWSASEHAALIRPQLTNPTLVTKDPAGRVGVPFAAIAPKSVQQFFSIGEDHHVLALLNHNGPLQFAGVLFGQMCGFTRLSDAPWPACDALEGGGAVFVIECQNRVLRRFTLLGFCAAREQGAWGEYGVGQSLDDAVDFDTPEPASDK